MQDLIDLIAQWIGIATGGNPLLIAAIVGGIAWFLIIKPWLESSENLEKTEKQQALVTTTQERIAAGDAASALDLLKHALAADPDNFSIRFDYAKALLQADEHKRAAYQLKHLLSMAPAHREVQSMLAAARAALESQSTSDASDTASSTPAQTESAEPDRVPCVNCGDSVMILRSTAQANDGRCGGCQRKIREKALIKSLFLPNSKR